MTTPRRRMTPDELLRSKVGANIRRALRRLWVGDVEFEELCEVVQPTVEGVQAAIDALAKEGKKVDSKAVDVAEEMWLAPEDITALAREMGLGERVEPECHLPSPEEIRIATAQFRAGWSDGELESRLQGPTWGTINYAPRRDNPCPPKCD